MEFIIATQARKIKPFLHFLQISAHLQTVLNMVVDVDDIREAPPDCKPEFAGEALGGLIVFEDDQQDVAVPQLAAFV